MAGEIIERKLTLAFPFDQQQSKGVLGDLEIDFTGSGLVYGGNPADGAALQIGEKSLSGLLFMGESDKDPSTLLSGGQFRFASDKIFTSLQFTSESGNPSNNIQIFGGSLEYQVSEQRWQMDFAKMNSGYALFLKSDEPTRKKIDLNWGLRYYRNFENDLSSPPTYLGVASTLLEDHRSVFLESEYDAMKWGLWNMTLDVFKDQDQSGFFLGLEGEKAVSSSVTLNLRSELNSQPEKTLLESFGIQQKLSDIFSWDAQLDLEIRKKSRLDLEVGLFREVLFWDLEGYSLFNMRNLLEEDEYDMDMGISKEIGKFNSIGLRYNLEYIDHFFAHELQFNWTTDM